MGKSTRLRLRQQAEGIKKDIESIKNRLNTITDEIGQDYPHISVMVITVDDTLNIVNDEFVKRLIDEF